MIISTEQVSKYHPDKYADQISDAILTECLKQDKNSHCGIETMVKGTTVVLGGEITSNADVDYEKVVKRVANKLGYRVDAIVNLISKQSPEIQTAVDSDEDIGAGDQGIMFGYAVNETEELLPTAFVLANKIIKAIENDVENNAKTILLGDAKTQVSWDADKKEVVSVLVSTCHNANSGLNKVRRYIKNLLKDIIPKECKTIMINPAGTWNVGGPISDCGLTGRKIVCDQYGGFCRVGGGCVDRETEVLTKTGWKKICDFDEVNDKIAQWDGDYIQFVDGEFVKLPKTKMWRTYLKNSIDMVLSDDHNFLYRTSKNNYRKVKFKQVIDKYFNTDGGFRGDIPISYKYDFSDNSGENLSDSEIRLQIAFCADGTIQHMDRDKPEGRIQIKKEYKKERLEKLLHDCGVEYKKTTGTDGFSRYYFEPPIMSKSLYECFSNVNLCQAKIVAEEVVMWDGNRADKFRTTSKEDADFIQFIFSSIYGKNSTIHSDDRVGDVYCEKYMRKNICYEVSVGKREFTTPYRKVKKNRAIVEEYDDGDIYMYCVNVPSHNLVLRRNNRVFVTGNCFSGKDPSKVDRSASYMARRIAKDLVKEFSLKEATVQLGYAIGVSKPFSVSAIGYTGTEFTDLSEWVNTHYDLTPKGIIEHLGLYELNYEKLAEGCHYYDTDI